MQVNISWNNEKKELTAYVVMARTGVPLTGKEDADLLVNMFQGINCSREGFYELDSTTKAATLHLTGEKDALQKKIDGIKHQAKNNKAILLKIDEAAKEYLYGEDYQKRYLSSKLGERKQQQLDNSKKQTYQFIEKKRPKFQDLMSLESNQPNSLVEKIRTEEEADLCKYPDAIKHPSGTVVTFGDMHGNAMKFMWELIHNGVISLNPGDYTKAMDLYKGSELISGDALLKHSEFYNSKSKLELTDELKNKLKSDLEKYRQILGRIKFTPNAPGVRLLGDFIADRGNNDIMTLLLLEKITTNSVKVEIINSNHDVFILPYYDKDPAQWRSNLDCTKGGLTLGIGYGIYIAQLQCLVQNEIVSHEEFKVLMKNAYLPNFKLLSYALQENQSGDAQITLFMHAPNNLEPIYKLAEQLNIAFDNTSKNAKGLAKVIDAININFNLLTQEEKSRLLIDANGIEAQKTADYETPYSDWGTGVSPIHALIWNYGGGKYLGEMPAYVKKIVHGHVGEVLPKKIEPRDENLDTYLGRSNIPTGKYLAHVAIEPKFKIESEPDETSCLHLEI